MATASEAWFKLISPESSWSIVSLEGIKYVDHLKKAIKKEVAIKLNNYDAADLTIKATYDDEDPKVQWSSILRMILRKFLSELRDRNPQLCLPLRTFGSLSFFHLSVSP
ncbi:hypothetical protein BDZ91DRAFT_761430 [Kalaharituber pfeilii]|nr:hypothetical protein BDZ91DRAFT_761430 [Kalaharituber pfeilii]